MKTSAKTKTPTKTNEYPTPPPLPTHTPFLDVNASLLKGKIMTDLYSKSIYKHQYLLNSSCHPIHTKRTIPFRLALRLRRICSTNETFTLPSLIAFLQQREYNGYFLKREIPLVDTNFPSLPSPQAVKFV